MKIWLDTFLTEQTHLAQYDCCDMDCVDGERDLSMDIKHGRCISDSRNGDYDDNDCNPESRVSPVSYLLPVNGSQRISTGLLKQATPLYMQECAPGRWLVCNPTGAGHLVIVDAQGQLLLEQFRTAKSLAEVVPLVAKVTDMPPKSVEVAVEILYVAGLLQRPDELPSMHSYPESQLTAWLHMTNACNLRCHYCYVDKTAESMTEDIAFRAVDAVFRSATKHGFKAVNLKYAGGEASLQQALVLATHDYAAQLAQEHSIILHDVLLSNGVELKQHMIEQLKMRNIRVAISLDGIGSYHDSQRPFINGQGSFIYVDRTISSLLANGLIPSIAVTVSQRNLDGLADLLVYILKRDLPFTLSYYRDNGYAIDRSALQFDEQQMISTMHSAFKVIEQNLPKRRLLGSLIDRASLHHPHQYTCGVGRNYLVIDQYGRIAKCHAAIKQTVTTIETADPLEIIQKDRRGVQGLTVEEKEGCQTCDWRYWCAGGCPLLTYRMTKRYDIKSPNCRIYQALFPEVLHLEALRLLKYETPIILQDLPIHC